jgi:hypothetical protein
MNYINGLSLLIAFAMNVCTVGYSFTPFINKSQSIELKS